MAETGVTFRGLDQFRRELNRAVPGFSKELGKEYKKISGVIAAKAEVRIRSTAKGRGGTFGGTRYRASASARSGRVNISGRNPRALGDEFGSHAYKQFKPWRGNQWSGWPEGGVGYALHPVIREEEPFILGALGDAFENALKRAYPEGGR